ncbi:hypothetical protein FBU59_001727, partial [Linderina macrospora]
ADARAMLRLKLLEQKKRKSDRGKESDHNEGEASGTSNSNTEFSSGSALDMPNPYANSIQGELVPASHVSGRRNGTQLSADPQNSQAGRSTRIQGVDNPELPNGK